MELQVFDGSDTSESNLSSIVECFHRDGLVCLAVLDQPECDALVLEQWREILFKQPWLPEYLIRVQSEDGRQLCMERDRDEFLQAVRGPLSPGRRKHFEEGWCLHRGFGACCDPAVFHLEGVWRIRQDPRLFEVGSRLSGTRQCPVPSEPCLVLDNLLCASGRKLWVDINRSIQKLPGQGETEFLHWDFNPFEFENLPEGPGNISGKVVYTESRFVAALGTHTKEFLREFVSAYKPLYPNVKKSAAKFGLDAKKPDPLGLFARQQVFRIPAGCAVFWSEQLLHGQVKTPLNAQVEYGCYLGFFPAGSRAAYEAACGRDEREDRLQSFADGRAPRLWPGLDRVHLFPLRFQNFPKLLQRYIDKMPREHPMICSRVTAAGKTVPHLQPTPRPDYRPPQLTALGRKLLGLDSWEEEEVEEEEEEEEEKVSGLRARPARKRKRSADGVRVPKVEGGGEVKKEDAGRAHKPRDKKKKRRRRG